MNTYTGTKQTTPNPIEHSLFVKQLVMLVVTKVDLGAGGNNIRDLL